jgi:hypothetical protein
MKGRNLVLHRFPNIIAACLLLFARFPNATAQTDTIAHPPIVSVGAFLLGTTMSIYTHELGHLTFDYLMGASSAHINFWPPSTSAQFPNDASTFQKSFPVLAGPLATRFLSEGVDYLLNNATPPRWLSTIGGAWYLAMRFDLPWQVLTSSVSHLVNPTGKRRDDIFKGFVEPWFSSQSSRNLAYVLLIISQIIDIYLDADEIADNYRRLIGTSNSNKTNQAGTLHLSLFENERAIGISYAIRF